MGSNEKNNTQGYCELLNEKDVKVIPLTKIVFLRTTQSTNQKITYRKKE